MALPEGYSFTRPSDRMYSSVMPRPGMRFAYSPSGERKEVPSSNSIGSANSNTVDPVLQSQRTAETITDPLVRALYFGTDGTPGFYNQLQQAGANLIGSDVPLQQTAGLDPLETQARQRAQAGLGAFQPFFTQQQDLVNQAIEQSRRSEQLQDPYFTQAQDLIQGTVGAYDPSMTEQFYNPYENAVVQQTIDDVMKAGDQQDIAARAQAISAGGESAFGSRARLSADERREALGRGLGDALSNIRSRGFSQAQQTGLGEFARQKQAERSAASGLLGIGAQRGASASQLGSQLAGYGGQLAGIGQNLEALNRGQRSELAGFGANARNIAEMQNQRQYGQQMQQQMRPLQTMQGIGSLLPGYKQAGSQIDSTYGMAPDPSAQGLGAAFSAYGALVPGQRG